MNKNSNPLRDYRLASGMTQMALSIKSGVNITTLGRLEVYPNLMPSSDIASRLASALGCRIKDLWKI